MRIYDIHRARTARVRSSTTTIFRYTNSIRCRQFSDYYHHSTQSYSALLTSLQLHHLPREGSSARDRIRTGWCSSLPLQCVLPARFNHPFSHKCAGISPTKHTICTPALAFSEAPDRSMESDLGHDAGLEGARHVPASSDDWNDENETPKHTRMKIQGFPTCD